MRFLQLPDSGVIRDPSSYLFRIALNLISEWRWRRDRASITYDSDLAEQEGNAAARALPDELEQAVMRERLYKVLEQVPPTYRQVLLWSRCDGLTPAEIAAKLNITPETVFTYLARATAFARKAQWD